VEKSTKENEGSGEKKEKGEDKKVGICG